MKEVKDPTILAEFGIFPEKESVHQDESLLDKFGGYAKKFNQAVESSRLPSIAGGFLQGMGDIGASVANLPMELAGGPKISHPDLGKYLPQDMLSKGAFLGGELGAGIPGWLGIEGAISKLLPSAKGLKNVGQRALSGGLTGAALGEQAPGGRGVSAGLGAAASPLSGLSSSKISQDIVKQRNAVSKEYNQKYESIFSKAKEEGLKDIKLPSVNYDLIQGSMPSKQFRSIRELQNNPTIENAHRAQSDLGKFISSKKNKPNDSETNKALKEAIVAQKKLKGKIHTELSSVKGLSPEYQKVTKGYEKDVVPYKYNKDITKYIENELGAGGLVNKLTKNEKFMMKQGKKHPELKVRGLLKKPATKIGLGLTAAGLGLPKGYEYISSSY